MYDSQLLKILKTLNKADMRELNKFVQSPYLNTRADVVALCHYLVQHHGGLPSFFQKAIVFKAIYPEKKNYDDGIIRFIMHALLKIVKKYLIQKELENRPFSEQMLLIQALRRRNLDNFFEQEIQQAHQLHDENKQRNAEFFFFDYQLQYEQQEFLSLTKRQADMPLQSATNALTQFYVIEMLRHACVALASEAIVNSNIELPMMSAVLDWVKNHLSDTHNKGDNTQIVMRLFYLTYTSLESKNILIFNELYDLLQLNWHLLSESEGRLLRILAINFCIRKSNTGAADVRRRLFELYRSGIDNKLLFENGFLSKFTFKNVVATAILVKEFDWVKTFLDTHKQDIHPREREMMYQFGLASYYFSQKNYDKAMPLLSRFEANDAQMSLLTKSMLLRMYYECGEWNVLESLLDSFQTYIRRQKDVGYLSEQYSNLIKTVRKMMKTDLTNPKNRQILRGDIEAQNKPILKDWLLERLA